MAADRRKRTMRRRHFLSRNSRELVEARATAVDSERSTGVAGYGEAAVAVASDGARPRSDEGRPGLGRWAAAWASGSVRERGALGRRTRLTATARLRWQVLLSDGRSRRGLWPRRCSPRRLRWRQKQPSDGRDGPPVSGPLCPLPAASWQRRAIEEIFAAEGGGCLGDGRRGQRYGGRTAAASMSAKDSVRPSVFERTSNGGLRGHVW